MVEPQKMTLEQAIANVQQGLANVQGNLQLHAMLQSSLTVMIEALKVRKAEPLRAVKESE